MVWIENCWTAVKNNDISLFKSAVFFGVKIAARIFSFCFRFAWTIKLMFPLFGERYMFDFCKKKQKKRKKNHSLTRIICKRTFSLKK